MYVSVETDKKREICMCAYLIQDRVSCKLFLQRGEKFFDVSGSLIDDCRK